MPDPEEMGYAGRMRFEPADLALLSTSEEVEIETTRPPGPAHRTIIWVVTDNDEAFIRSVNGAGARWYREALANPAVTIHVAGHPVPATVHPASDPAAVQRTSDALTRKYAGDPSLASMLEPDILETTLRLTPA